LRYRAIFFDAGDTLLAPHPSFADVFVDVMRHHGHGIEVHDVERVFEDVAPFFVEILEKTGQPTWSTSRETSLNFWRTVYHTAFERLGIEDDDFELATALYERFTKYESYRLFPDVLPTLTALKETGLTLGVISNFEEWLDEMLTAWEVTPLFDLLVISGKEGVEKPEPRIFEIALEKSGARPDESVYVGDHPRLDYEGAESMGMTAVLIDRRGRFPDFEGRRITTLSELAEVVGLDAVYR
jgi:putative hydrolase of the HAD superfamily